jgi:hypothetical protein
MIHFFNTEKYIRCFYFLFNDGGKKHEFHAMVALQALLLVTRTAQLLKMRIIL